MILSEKKKLKLPGFHAKYTYNFTLEKKRIVLVPEV